MIDIRWNDRATASDFIADEFGRDEFWDRCSERLAGVLVVERTAIGVRCSWFVVRGTRREKLPSFRRRGGSRFG
jgi:hypothetical protein